MNKIPLTLCASLALAVAGTSQSRKPDPIKIAKAVLAKAADSVVNVGSVVHLEASMMGQRDEETMTLGTVVDASGLTLVSRSALNPFGYEPMEFEAQPGMDIRIDAEISSVWLQLASGKRVEAEVVLTDPDLDVSLLRPIDTEAAKKIPFTVAPFGAKNGPKVSTLDTVIALSRLGKEVGWAPSVHMERVSAVLDTPRRCITVRAQHGSAVFSADGHFLGSVVTVPSTDKASSGMGGMPPGGALMGQRVVLPQQRIRALVESLRQKGADNK